MIEKSVYIVIKKNNYFPSAWKPLLLALLTLALFIGSCKKANPPLPKKADFNLYEGIINSTNSVVLGADGNLVFAFRNNLGLLTLTKTSTNGDYIYQKQLGITQTNNQFFVAISGDGSIFIATATQRNFTFNNYDILLVKCNSEGDTVWTRTLGGSNSEIPSAMKRTKDGNILILGRVAVNSSINLWTIKLDASGNDIWNTLNTTSGVVYPTDFVETTTGEIWVSGLNNTGGTYLARLNSTGNKLDQNTILVGSFGSNNTILQCNDGGFLISAYDGSDVNIVKVDQNCRQQWTRKLGYSDHLEVGMYMTKNKDGTITIAGYSSGPKTNQTPDILLIKIHENGDPIWYRAFGGKNSDYAYRVFKDLYDDNVVVGVTNSFSNNFTNQIFTVLVDGEGNFK